MRILLEPSWTCHFLKCKAQFGDGGVGSPDAWLDSEARQAGIDAHACPGSNQERVGGCDDLRSPLDLVAGILLHYSTLPVTLLVFLAAAAGAGVVTANLRLPDDRLRGLVADGRGSGRRRHRGFELGQPLRPRILRVEGCPPLHFSDGICDKEVSLATPRFRRGHIPLDALKVRDALINQILGVRLPDFRQQLRCGQVGYRANQPVPCKRRCALEPSVEEAAEVLNHLGTWNLGGVLQDSPAV